jgi:hypothetical protein
MTTANCRSLNKPRNHFVRKGFKPDERPCGAIDTPMTRTYGPPRCDRFAHEQNVFAAKGVFDVK